MNLSLRVLEHSVRLGIVPTTLREANAFVDRHHRHHPPARGCICVVACAAGNRLVGVAIIGRPVARLLDSAARERMDFTAEVTRCCTDGFHNSCSTLYGACWRAARALGYRRLITYTLPDEGGASLRAAGFRVVAETQPGTWDRSNRPRVDLHAQQQKLRWEVAA